MHRLASQVIHEALDLDGIETGQPDTLAVALPGQSAEQVGKWMATSNVDVRIGPDEQQPAA
jgi:hypothetical protein